MRFSTNHNILDEKILKKAFNRSYIIPKVYKIQYFLFTHIGGFIIYF